MHLDPWGNAVSQAAQQNEAGVDGIGGEFRVSATFGSTAVSSEEMNQRAAQDCAAGGPGSAALRVAPLLLLSYGCRSMVRAQGDG